MRFTPQQASATLWTLKASCETPPYRDGCCQICCGLLHLYYCATCFVKGPCAIGEGFSGLSYFQFSFKSKSDSDVKYEKSSRFPKPPDCIQKRGTLHLLGIFFVFFVFFNNRKYFPPLGGGCHKNCNIWRSPGPKPFDEVWVSLCTFSPEKRRLLSHGPIRNMCLSQCAVCSNQLLWPLGEWKWH